MTASQTYIFPPIFRTTFSSLSASTHTDGPCSITITGRSASSHSEIIPSMNLTANYPYFANA